MTHREKTYLDPYRQALREHGPGFKATLWATEEAQKLRFDVMHDMADFEGCSILDAGCGHGELAAHLLERGVQFTRYHGIDALEELIEAASARSLPRSTFAVADMISHPQVLAEHAADYVCLSGSLNTIEEPAARRIVRSAFDAASQGVVFNFLSDRPHPRWANRDVSPARRFDTLAWLDWSMQLSSRVSFTQEYLDGHDATILIRHDG